MFIIFLRVPSELVITKSLDHVWPFVLTSCVVDLFFFSLSNVDYLYHAICYASFSTKLCVICTKRVIAMVKNGTDFVHPIWFNTFHLKSAKLRAHMKYVCILNNILTMFRKEFQAPLNLVSTATNRKNLIIKYKYE